MGVLQTEQDFYDLMQAYIARAQADRVVHAEIFFDPQTHTGRGISIATVISGLSQALRDARESGFSGHLILCFLRHLSEAEAFATLEAALPFRQHFIGVGLDSSERGHPPGKFAQVFARAAALGLHCVAHAGEEGPPQYVADALDRLQVERIDHGVRSVEAPALLAREQIPLTLCPLSNEQRNVSPDLRRPPLKTLLESGVCAMLNSDDPAYFGGYMNANWLAMVDALPLSADDLRQLARNSFRAAFLSPEQRTHWLAEVNAS